MMTASAKSWESLLDGELERRARGRTLRSLRPYRHDGRFLVAPDGRRLLDLSSNDYLGLASHPLVIEGAAAGAQRGAGSRASRLVVGTDPETLELEERLASFQQRERALLFSSGYLANLGVISALVGREDAVVSDKSNHASILDGCQLSRATIYRYRHGDLVDFEAKLDQASKSARRVLVVTESVFSMDGDVAPLEEIVALKNHYGAALLLDEAHGDGVFGARGEGYANELGLDKGIDLHLGTFGKAFGCAGAYVAGSDRFIAYLVNTSRSFIFTTAIPPAVIGAIDAALGLVIEADSARHHLRAMSSRLRAGLQALSLDTHASVTQIVPLIVGGSEDAVALSKALEAAGILAVAIRPPTVPEGTARLRLSVSAVHQPEDIDAAVKAIAGAVHDIGAVPYGRT